MTHTDNFFHEAKSLFATGHPEESIKFFTKAEKNGCNPVTVFLSRGVALINIGQFEDSIDDFNNVLAVDTDNDRALYYRGVAHLLQGEFIEAIDDLSSSIMFNHDSGATFLARGLAHAELDHLEQSLRDLKIAVAFSNIDIEIFANPFGENRTLFGKSMALLEGDDGPWSIVMNKKEVNKLKKWIEH